MHLSAGNLKKKKKSFLQKTEKGLSRTVQSKKALPAVEMMSVLKVFVSDLRKHLQVCSLISVQYYCKVNTAWFKQLKMVNS